MLRRLALFNRLTPRSGLAVVPWDARVSGLDDGSESTIGQDGHYVGKWCDEDGHAPFGHGCQSVAGSCRGVDASTIYHEWGLDSSA